MPWALVASFVVASAALTARTLAWLPKQSLGTLLPWLQSLAAGLLLGDSLLHMLPEALAQGISFQKLGQLFVLGILGLLSVEYVIRTFVASKKAPFAQSNIAADVIHHFVDGMIVGASFSVENSIGWAVTVAIMLHELPRELSNAGVLMAAGYSREKAFWLTLATTGAIPLGAATIALAGQPSFIGASLAFAAGTMLYLACGDLIPALWGMPRQPRAMALPIGVGGGVALMWLLGS